MQFSQKQKTASQFFTTFSKPRLNFQHFHKKAHLIAVFLNLRTPKNVDRQMSKKSRFRGSLDK